jgi:hypothetical protein
MSDLQEAILYYADHPYEFVIDMFGLKPCSITREEYIVLSDDKKVEFMKEHPDEITWQQKLVLDILPKALKEGKGIAIKAGHGIGKSCLEAWIIHWFMATRPFPKVPCTATNQHQLFDILWSELSKWHMRFKAKEMFKWQPTSFRNTSYPETWFAVARTSDKPDGMQGFHGEHLMFIVEEASGVSTETMEVIEGTQTEEGSITIYLGNPTQLSGGFFDAFHAKRPFFECFTFSCEESPRVKPGYYRKIEAKYGKDSDIYRVRVLGEFPKAEPDSLLSLSLCEAAANREMEIPDKATYEVVEIGCDVARFGDDSTTIYTRIENFIKEELIINESRDLMYVTGKIVEVIKKYHETKTVLVNIDDSGLGGGVTDRLNELVREDVIRAVIYPVNNGESAKDKEDYFNCGTEMWGFMKDFLQEAKIPNDNDLLAELSTRKYKVNSKGQMILEPKDQYKKRIKSSPDRADGVILTTRSLIYGITQKRDRSFAC